MNTPRLAHCPGIGERQCRSWPLSPLQGEHQAPPRGGQAASPLQGATPVARQNRFHDVSGLIQFATAAC